MRVIAQISDTHLGERIEGHMELDPKANLLLILEDIKKRGIGEIVITGDICSSDSAGWFKELLEEYGLRYSLVLGNHDDQEVMKTVFGLEKNYFLDCCDSRICMGLDSSRGVVDEAQLNWLTDGLIKAEEKEKEAVIFIHHPILDCDNSVMDRKYPLLNRSEIESLINSINIKVSVFCGHYHRSDVREKGSIKQYVAPSTLYQLKQNGEELEVDNKPIGYRIIVFDKEIKTEEVRIDNA